MLHSSSRAAHPSTHDARFTLFAWVVLGALACEPREEVDLDAIETVAHGMWSASAGVYVYPPLAPEPTPAGVADTTRLAGLGVHLDEVDAAGVTLRTTGSFTRATSPALGLIDQGQYLVRVPAAQYLLTRGARYRFRVLYLEHELAFADVPADIWGFLDRSPTVVISVRFRVDQGALDADGDGTPDWLDDCPSVADGDQTDTDRDGVGDACECRGVVCGPADVCQLPGACEPTTGACVYAPRPDGAFEGTVATACGVGACAAAGRTECRAGALVDTCTIGHSTGDDVDLNGRDDDCDGAIDEHWTVPCTATVQSGVSCPGTALPASRCFRVQLTSCPGVPDLGVLLKISDPVGPARGTIVLGTGGGGTAFYEAGGPNTATHLLQPLHQAGFRIVQRAWEGNYGWLTGPGGALRAAVRSAKMFEVIHQIAQTPGTPLCASGNSGGASEIAYALAHYGAGRILDLAVPTSGPPMGRIDLGCLPDLVSTWRNECAALQVGAYGYGLCEYVGMGVGIADAVRADHACSTRDATSATSLYEESVLNGRAALAYPATPVRFLFGSLDQSEAVPLGRLYANAVTSDVRVNVVDGASHALMESIAGADAIASTLMNECLLRH